MTKTELDLSADVIDVRDIIARVEELEELREADREEFDADPANAGVDFDNWVCNQLSWDREQQNELDNLRAILRDLEGNGGDEEWRGDWYPVTLIRESYFEQAMDELVADCYSIPELPSFMTITLDYRALQMDYTSTEIDGSTYFYR
jgi:hypothetical protein